MPSPAIYADDRLDPFEGISSENISRRATLFYATDRQPATAEDPQASYNNERGLALRTGIASVTVDRPIGTWQDARRIFLSSERATAHSAEILIRNVYGPLRYIDDPRDRRQQGRLSAATRSIQEQALAGRQRQPANPQCVALRTRPPVDKPSNPQWVHTSASRPPGHEVARRAFTTADSLH
jgi:hypothetical protein